MGLSQESVSGFTIRTMGREALALAVDWAAAEGWNPGLHDADCFYAADEGGFLVGLLDGEAIASISVVKYGETFGFLGFYIVRPEFRGRGYGWQMWQAGLARLAGRTVGLDGVLEQQENYLKSGFKLAHRNVRYEGIRETGSDLGELGERIEGKIVDLVSMPFEMVRAYDKEIFGYGRSDFLGCWVGSAQHRAVGVIVDEQLVGYGVLRPCREGYKIGPLFADSAMVAEAIFLALIENVEVGCSFYLDVVSVNEAAVALAQRYGMRSVFETARMYTREAPNLPLKRIFGMTTFELG